MYSKVNNQISFNVTEMLLELAVFVNLRFFVLKGSVVQTPPPHGWLFSLSIVFFIVSLLMQRIRKCYSILCAWLKGCLNTNMFGKVTAAQKGELQCWPPHIKTGPWFNPS